MGTLIEVTSLPQKLAGRRDRSVISTHRPSRVLPLLRTVMTNQKQTNHDASYARQHRDGTGNLRSGRKDIELACTRYEAVVYIGNDYARDGEEPNICCEHHG